jgi:hypothetical protein
MAYTREMLIELCDAAIVPVGEWRNRDSPSAYEQLGLATILLKTGCQFYIHKNSTKSGCFTDDDTIWLTIEWPSFDSFEYGTKETQSQTFYIPTQKRLLERKGKDWY